MDEWGSVPATKNVYDQENLGELGLRLSLIKFKKCALLKSSINEEAEQNKTIE